MSQYKTCLRPEIHIYYRLPLSLGFYPVQLFVTHSHAACIFIKRRKETANVWIADVLIHSSKSHSYANMVKGLLLFFLNCNYVINFVIIVK